MISLSIQNACAKHALNLRISHLLSNVPQEREVTRLGHASVATVGSNSTLVYLDLG